MSDRNLALAASTGFDPGLLREEGFQKRWAVFRDSESCKFLRLFTEKRITELQAMMENAKPEDIQKLQGQVLEARKLAGFLAQNSIANEVASMKTWLGK